MWKTYRFYFLGLLVVLLLVSSGTLVGQPGQLRPAAAVLLGGVLLEVTMESMAKKKRGEEQSYVMILMLGLAAFLALLLLPG